MWQVSIETLCEEGARGVSSVSASFTRTRDGVAGVLTLPSDKRIDDGLYELRLGGSLIKIELMNVDPLPHEPRLRKALFLERL